MKTTLAIAGAILCATLASSVAWAGGLAEARAVRVSTAGLDLDSAKGLARLERRLAAAARAACGTPSPADPLAHRRLEACRAGALSRVAAPALARR